jgi:lipoic acid synthetase
MRKHPDWLKVKRFGGETYRQVKTILRETNLHTICQEAKCPNIGECFERGTAVFLILGDVCTRNCSYCNVSHGVPRLINQAEPQDIAKSVKKLGLSYVVITSVTRDDLPDGGAHFFNKTITAIKSENKRCKVEVLIPDFLGNKTSLQKVMDAHPDVVNHNIEVVKELFPIMRPQGNYQRSLNLLKNIKDINKTVKSKSGLMIGLGETMDQLLNTLYDLRDNLVDIITIGQYLQPSPTHVEIVKYYTPEEFTQLKTKAQRMGFSHVEAGPLVRSSYHAEEAFAH